jgi:hypothetical protein
MRDRLERVCSSSWRVEANVSPQDKDMDLTLAPGTVQATDPRQFRAEPPKAPTAGSGLHVKVLVNFAPQKQHAATLTPIDTSALVSLLRRLSRDERIGSYSLVAFNLNNQRVLFRQDNVEQIDFPALGASLQDVSPGTVDLQMLADKGSGTRFLTDLMNQELALAGADAVVFAGPKAMLEGNVPAEEIEKLSAYELPVYYFNYALNPFLNPWRDTIGKAVKSLKGVEYTIRTPRDIWRSVSEMVSRIAESGNQEAVAGVSGK